MNDLLRLVVFALLGIVVVLAGTTDKGLEFLAANKVSYRTLFP